MNNFKFHRELDVPHLQEHYGNDIFSAREIMGSFIEVIEEEYGLLDASLRQKEYTVFARTAQRLVNGLELLGMKKELDMLRNFRSQLASYGMSESLEESGHNFLEAMYNRRALLKVELNRMNEWLESWSGHN